MIRVIRSRNKQSDTHFYLRNPIPKDKMGIDKVQDKPKEYKATPIILMFKYNKKLNLRLKYSTGENINPKLWDDKKERVKASVTVDYKNINEKLDQISKSAKAIVKDKPNICIVDFRNKLDDIIGKTYAVVTSNQDNICPTFLEWTESFITRESGKLDVSHLTIKKYKSEYNKIKRFIEKKLPDTLITFDDIDFKFISSYKNYLYEAPLNSSQNTVSKSFEVLGKFLKSASKDLYVNDSGVKVPVSTNLIHIDDEFGVGRIKTSKSILTFDQLLHLYQFDFSQYETLSRVRYLFLLMAFTGLRISDMLSFSRKSIIKEPDGKLTLKVFIKKGKERKEDTEVFIFVIPELKEIFEMYNYNIPNDITEQSMNKYIKDVCKVAGFDDIVQMKISAGGKTKTIEKPLYETITNHTARFSFITWAINEFGIRAEELQKITGQSLKVLLGYEKGNKKDNAKRVADTITKLRKL